MNEREKKRMQDGTKVVKRTKESKNTAAIMSESFFFFGRNEEKRV